ncbi:MAG TPA: serine hydrolase domain-containing protein [Chthoniobacteraceae bacterium]|nr:serine hydrolase domain-containing protein [Chthoniobacteraceae bacterium]
MKTKSLFATFLTAALLTSGYAETLDKVKLDQFFDRLAEKKKAMGSLTIVKDGQVLYTRAIGYAQVDATAKKPLTEASRFRIASITKTYTAVMILQLVEEGKLKLTDTLGKFFPRVANARKITIRQILAHRSGIPNVRREQATWKPGAAVTKDEMLAVIVKGTPEFEPDTKSSYSNSGYFLLGLILEKLTGKPYDQALEERINSRIGLKDTYLATGRIDVNKGEALTYANTGGDWKRWRDGFETHPSIGFQLISTPGDMAKFIAALFDLKLISQDSLHQMKTMIDDEGFGLVTFTFAGKTFYGNTGGGDNYGSWLAYQPEEKLAVAYATNAKVHPVKDIVSGVIDIYYGKPFEIPAFATIAVSPEVVERYVGVYSSSDAPKKFTITRNGGTLFVQPGSESAAALEATAQDKFQLVGGRVVIEFDAAKNQMILKRGGRSLVFTKEK